MGKSALLSSLGSGRVLEIVQFKVAEGADLLEAIEEGVKASGISCGVFVSGLGALRRAVFRNLKWWPKEFPVKPEDRLYLTLEQPLELLSLSGWIAPREGSEEVEVHAHFTASTVMNDTVAALGGHLTKGTIAGIKVIVAIAKLEMPNARVVSDESTRSSDIAFD